MASKSAPAAVILSTIATGSPSEAVISLVLGLAGVSLARQVFLNREKRTTGRAQGWRETLPLTLCAMLITGVIIWDRQLGFSMAVFTGLAVGWTAILLLGVLGSAVLKKLRLVFGVTEDDLGIGPEEKRLLDQLDSVPGPGETRE